MRLRTRGLLVGGVDRELYVERPSVEASLLDPIISGGNVLVVGPAGAGKTTALRRLEADLAARNMRSCFVNGALVETSEDLLELIAEGLGQAYAPVKPGGTPLLGSVRRLSAAEPSTILIDGPLPGGVSRELFGRFRDELWSLEHRWALTSTPTAATPLRLPPADAFWDQVIKLPPLLADEVQDLLQRGLDPDERADLRSAGWRPPEPAWPRPVVRSVRDAFEGTDLRAPDEVQILREKQANLERVPAMVLAELDGLHRPAAAGDQELLQRLGYSRAYVARALAELEDRGLVLSSMESTEGKSGRPRKLYEPSLKGVRQ